eukprot:gene16741-biopygen2491
MERSAPDCTLGGLAQLSGCFFATRDTSSERRTQDPARRTQLNANAAERRMQQSERRTQDPERRTQLNANAAEDA